MCHAPCTALPTDLPALSNLSTAQSPACSTASYALSFPLGLSAPQIAFAPPATKPTPAPIAVPSGPKKEPTFAPASAPSIGPAFFY